MAIRLVESDLKIIKKLELEIACEIRRICDKYNLKYFIAFGTLLGAVRHGGFIPWDDDIDIVMARQEYDLFLKYAANDMDTKFQLVNYETNSYCGEPFTKIMYKGTVMQEEFAKNSKAPCGVFVDIFPYDSVPENRIQMQMHRFLNYELRKRILLKSDYFFNKTGLKKIVYLALKATTIGKKKTLVQAYRKNQCKYNSIATKKVVALGGNYGYIKDSIPRVWFDECISIQFEGEEFKTFKEYKKVLEHFYNDYMKLPPEEMRVNKHTVEQLDLSLFGGRKIMNQ